MGWCPFVCTCTTKILIESFAVVSCGSQSQVKTLQLLSMGWTTQGAMWRSARWLKLDSFLAAFLGGHFGVGTWGGHFGVGTCTLGWALGVGTLGLVLVVSLFWDRIHFWVGHLCWGTCCLFLSKDHCWCPRVFADTWNCLVIVCVLNQVELVEKENYLGEWMISSIKDFLTSQACPKGFCSCQAWRSHRRQRVWVSWMKFMFTLWHFGSGHWALGTW